MNIDWTYDGCDSDDERAIEQTWEDHLPELEAKLSSLPVEPVELRLAVTHDSESDAWELQGALHLTTRTLAVECVANTVQAAVQDCIGRLSQSIDELVDAPEEVSRRRQGLEAVLPLLEKNRAEGRSYQFFTFLSPLMRSLRTHVERELDILELEGAVSAEELEPDDVLNEALLRAWERFPERPRDLPIDLWLIGLLHDVLDELTAEGQLASIQAERDVALPEDDEQNSPSTWVEQPTYPETIELGELLPGHPGVDAWDRLDFETKQTKLAELLRGLSRDERQILVLHGVDGFEPAQIAALQDRSVEDVHTDLTSARTKLSGELEEL